MCCGEQAARHQTCAFCLDSVFHPFEWAISDAGFVDVRRDGRPIARITAPVPLMVIAFAIPPF